MATRFVIELVGAAGLARPLRSWIEGIEFRRWPIQYIECLSRKTQATDARMGLFDCTGYFYNASQSPSNRKRLGITDHAIVEFKLCRSTKKELILC